MPIFEYECLECQHQFEYLLRSASADVACPSCGRPNVERQISLCAVSSDVSRAANLSAAHRRAAARRQEKQRSEHAHHHDHFGDTAQPEPTAPGGETSANTGRGAEKETHA